MAIPAPTFNRNSICPGDRLCAAVSGGADSVALLLLLHSANTLPHNGLGVGLSAVHIHHGLRGEAADADLAFVEDLCAHLKVSLHVRHVDTAGRVASHHETIEEAARGLRYASFQTLIVEGHADSILTAHTLDDQAETVLMKLLRGAWTEGLSGIHPSVTLPQVTLPHATRPGRILRPLLAARRADLRAWLGSLPQPWREDASNADESFTRNRLRHTVLPMLREENPNLDQVLANLAELAREEEARWQSELRRVLPHLLLPGKPVRGGGRAVSTALGDSAVAVEIERLRALDPALRRRVLRGAARQLGARLTFDETARLLNLAGLAAGTAAEAAASPGLNLHLAGGLRAERSPRQLRLYRSDPFGTRRSDSS